MFVEKYNDELLLFLFVVGNVFNLKSESNSADEA